MGTCHSWWRSPGAGYVCLGLNPDHCEELMQEGQSAKPETFEQARDRARRRERRIKKIAGIVTLAVLGVGMILKLIWAP